ATAGGGTATAGGAATAGGGMVMTGASEVDLVDAGPPVIIDGGFTFTEGPQWVPALGSLLFTDIPQNRIWRHTPPSGFAEYRMPSGNANGIALAPNGDLFICEHAGRVSRTQPDGGQSLVANMFNGGTLNSPNDAVVRSDGTLYFTDPSYGGTGTVGTRGVYRVAPGGALTRFYATNSGQPNGVTFSPDERILYVSDSMLSTVRRFDIAPDGTPDGGQLFVNTSAGGGGGGGDGITTDDNGFLYVTTGAGVKVFRPDAGYVGRIQIPGGRTPANCAFGDPDRRTLYITAGDALFKVRLNVTGPY
ncbi:MAG: SMP-30/gluconolactonase/LRE family protein, partial [Myxococcaceae bacterium]|nr:SMP-30/gluconolactonase/LRE family protein [Myxococcaceae bacterium]